jgi:hypothetical protein
LILILFLEIEIVAEEVWVETLDYACGIFRLGWMHEMGWAGLGRDGMIYLSI